MKFFFVKCVCQNVRTEKHKTWEHFEWSFYVISTLCLSTLFFKVRFGISFNPRSLSCGTFLMRLAHCTMYTRIAKDLSVTLSHEVQVQQHISVLFKYVTYGWDIWRVMGVDNFNDDSKSIEQLSNQIHLDIKF